MSDSRFNPNLVLKDFAERVERLGIAYMLTGSMAMIRYAMPRFTMDIDIVIELERMKQAAFIKAFEPDYYVPHQGVSCAVSQKRMFNIIHQASSFKIDCIVLKDGAFQRLAFQNRQQVEYKGFNVWTIAADDLVISKLLWAKDSHSEQQLRDVQNLLREHCNLEYITSWTQKLGIENLFQLCLDAIKK